MLAILVNLTVDWAEVVVEFHNHYNHGERPSRQPCARDMFYDSNFLVAWNNYSILVSVRMVMVLRSKEATSMMIE